MQYQRISNKEAEDMHKDPTLVPFCETHEWLKKSMIDLDPMNDSGLALYCQLCEIEERLEERRKERADGLASGNDAIVARADRRIKNFEQRRDAILALKDNPESV